MEEISSLQNQRVKEAIKLRESRGRRQQGRFLIDGAREIRRAIEARVEFDEVFLCKSLCESPDAAWAVEQLESSAALQFRVTEAVFQKLAFGDREEGILAVAKIPERSLDDLKLPETPVLAVIDRVEKPGNIGAVLRSADASGVSALLVADGGADVYNPNIIRASLGTIFTVPIRVAPAERIRDWLVARRFSIFAARVDAQALYHEADFRGPTAIVLGSEAHGLAPAWSGPTIKPIRLPMRGAGDSLNVSATAAVLFYEVVRQRRS